MADRADDTTWLESADGRRIGIRVDESPTGRTVRLLLPDVGVERTINAEDAARIVEMLNNGLSFAEITGAESFRVDINDL